MSGAEICRLKGAALFLRTTGYDLYYAVIGDSVLDAPERQARRIFQQFTNTLVQAQGRAGIPQFWIKVLESTGGLHANILFPASPRIAARLRKSKFRVYLGKKGLRKVDGTPEDLDRLTDYLAKERTSEADRPYGHRLGARRCGSHHLGGGGGDRVILSRALRTEVVAAGYVEPYKRTTSRNLTKPKRLLLPKGRDTFLSGRDLRVLRQRLGLTQEGLARRLGLRDHSRIAHVERGRSRLREPHLGTLRRIVETSQAA